MKKVLNIVVTGGPCGGKTTALDEIVKFLRSENYTVYLVNETATELINDGIKPFGDNKLDIVSFQSLLLDAQIAKENIRRKAALICSNDKVAILYDRGILDNRAYLDDDTFDEFLKSRGITETDILTSYDIVIHLVTAAFGKEEYYTTSNNQARTETVEMARKMDIKTRDTWKNHPNLNIINNDTLFDEKIEKVKNTIRLYLGDSEVIKKERYLVCIDDIDIEKASSSMLKEDIEAFVLDYDDLETIIYSKSTIKGSSYYTRVKNKFNKDESHAAVCRTINEEEYINNLHRLKGSLLNIVRYNFIDDGERFKLNIFKLDNNSFAILERDVVDLNRVKLPDFIKKYVNITNNRNYSMDSIFIDYNINKIFKKKMQG